MLNYQLNFSISIAGHQTQPPPNFSHSICTSWPTLLRQVAAKHWIDGKALFSISNRGQHHNKSHMCKRAADAPAPRRGTPSHEHPPSPSHATLVPRVGSFFMLFLWAPLPLRVSEKGVPKRGEYAVRLACEITKCMLRDCNSGECPV